MGQKAHIDKREGVVEISQLFSLVPVTCDNQSQREQKNRVRSKRKDTYPIVVQQNRATTSRQDGTPCMP